MILKDDIVISYWAIGPSYRQALIRNLKSHVFNKREHFKTIILTDCVEDFDLFCNELQLIAVLDINKQRKHYTWSFEIEPIPTAKTQQEYSEQFWDILSTGKRFSYSLHRFSIPWLVSNGYHRFILADGDARIENTDSLSLQEWVTANLDKRTTLVAYGDVRKKGDVFDKFYDTMKTILESRFPELQFPKCPDIHVHQDGPFRYYNFSNGYEAFKFFELWNNMIHYVLKDNILGLQETGMYGGSVYNDEFILGTLNRFLGIENTPITGPHIVIEHDPLDVKFYALSVGNYQLAATKEEFLKINNLDERIVL